MFRANVVNAATAQTYELSEWHSVVTPLNFPLNFPAAAALLDRMLQGEELQPQIIRIAPRAVLHRGSTQAVHATQPWLRKAIELIHTSVSDGLRVADIVKSISVSRRTLECAFVRELGRSVHDEILGARVEQAKRLLEETDLKPFQIALRCGFPFASGLSRSFSRVVGMTPVKYHQRFGRRPVG
jgi:LacI family transcriptional regulator